MPKKLDIDLGGKKFTCGRMDAFGWRKQGGLETINDVYDGGGFTIWQNCHECILVQLCICRVMLENV
ncbi:MAG: hypothetical protein NTY00_13175 [Deltaproteobacteria bacterium]|nr:hypothetical protein [Deltaproteobacteria bacterium]